MFEKILIPIDFSRHSERIVHRLPDLKRLGLEETVLLHVINPIKAVRWTDVNEQTLEEITASAKLKLQDIMKALSARHGMRVACRTEVGITDQEIVDVARAENASLIIMGAHGRSYIKGALPGSITQNVVKRTCTPVLIARFKDPEDRVEDNPHFFARDICTKILYPTDFSENALRAFRLLKSCRQEGDKEVILLHVQDRRTLLPYLKERLAEFNRTDGERLEGLKRQLEFVGFTGRTLLKTGVPFVEINKAAEDEDVTMIVLASHGRSNIKEALMGSVAENVIQHHIRPVLVVPRSGENR
jgi:nucleotide-binding universal stress UspA family protein